MQHKLLASSSPVAVDDGTQALTANSSTSGKRIAHEHHFASGDGSTLFYRYWPPLNTPIGPAIILLHRGHEHSGRVRHIVDEFNLPGFAIFAWDARGHGLSASAPAGGFATLVRDLDAFVRHVSSSYAIPMESIAIVGQSVGSVMAATWAHDYAPQIRCMVLATPAFRIKLYAPFAWPVLRLMHRLHGDFRINSYVKPRVLTHDPERIAAYKADPLITRPISVRVLLELEQASARVLADAQAVSIPTQILVSGRDWVVHTTPQIEFFERLGAQAKELHIFPGSFHDVLGEQDRAKALDRARQFILVMFARPCQRACLFDADNNGHTRAEFDTLSRPLPLFSRKRFRLGLIKLGLKVGSRFSPGIRLGFKTGFDSGSTLDYVYCNRPSGATPIRRLIDRSYLNSIGWKGIRRRKENLIQALLDSAARLRRQNFPVRILDIAAGHGRYVLEALEHCGVQADDVLLRDLSETNMLLGRMLAEEKKLSGKVRFETGDACNRESLARISPRPTLAVVSGLYELFPENRPVRESLAGLAEAIDPGGFLVYTGQPFHPQLEMIARTLPSHRDFRPWVMRRRTQAEIDQLVAAAGFRKISQQIDDWGIFSVSVAQRVAA